MLCFGLLLATQDVFVIDPGFYSRQNQFIKIEISKETSSLFDEVGFSVTGGSNEQLKKEWAFWIAKKENQDQFFEYFFNQTNDADEDVCQEVAEMLGVLKKAFQQWTDTLKIEKPSNANKTSILGMQYIAFSCTKKGCHCCKESDSIEEEIWAMREEIADLKTEAFDTALRAGAEAMGTGASLAAAQPEIAVVTGYLASKDVVKACETYNEAVELERRADDLERLLSEQDGVNDDSTTKEWWKFWK